jgi:hypothetical protein
MGVALADSFTGLTTFDAAKDIVVIVRGHDPDVERSALLVSNDNGQAIRGFGAKEGVLGSTTAGVGVHGTSHTGTAVEAESDFGTALKATSNGASSSKGNAVVAEANTQAGTFAAGVQASGDEAVVARGTSLGVDASANGTAVAGVSNTEVGGLFGGKEAPIRMFKASTAGAPQTGLHHAGEFYVDSHGLLFYCTADGTPGTWHQLAFTN